jgi:hypothetical protein
VWGCEVSKSLSMKDLTHVQELGLHPWGSEESLGCVKLIRDTITCAVYKDGLLLPAPVGSCLE